MTPMEYRLLGPLEARDGETRVELGGAKQRSVLAILMRAPGRRVGVEVLVDEVWGAGAPGAVRSLRTASFSGSEPR